MQDLGFFIVYIVDIHEFQILHELRILYEIQSLHERSVNRESNFWYSQFFQKMDEKKYPGTSEDIFDLFFIRCLEELRIAKIAFEIC